MSGKPSDVQAVRSQYSNWAAKYDEDTSSYGWSAPTVTLDALLRHLPPAKGLKVLDIGLGTGAASAPYLKHSEVTGLDLSPEMLDEARGRSTQYRQLSIYDINQPISTAQLETKAFDAVVSVGTLHFSNDLERTLIEAAKVLKPEGTLAFTFIPEQKRRFGPHTHLHEPKAVEDMLNRQGLILAEPMHSFIAYHDKGNEADPVWYMRVIARKAPIKTADENQYSDSDRTRLQPAMESHPATSPFPPFDYPGSSG